MPASSQTFNSSESGLDLTGRVSPPHAHLLAQAAQILLLAGAKDPHLAPDGRDVAGEDALDELATLDGEMDLYVAAICSVSLPADQSSALDVVNHHGDVAATAEQFSAEGPLIERALVEQDLEDAELALAEPERWEPALYALRDRAGRPRELDIEDANGARAISGSDTR
jgi:hypothetical protein